MFPHMRIVRPVRDIERAAQMYCRGLGLRVVGSFQNHDGLDGVMLGIAGAAYHFEFTRCPGHPVDPAPTPEDLTVFYIPDGLEWQTACERMFAAGFKRVAAFNPYWEARGRTYEDPDGYRIVLQQAQWVEAEQA